MSKPFKKQLKVLKRLRKSKFIKMIATAALLFAVTVGYAYYMDNQRSSVNPETYKPLLNLIANVESNGNYNAYFGNGGNTKIDFTKMSIGEVQQWQDEYVRQGSPSSAVGRYQIISTTLDGLVRDKGLDVNQKFDEQTQDQMAIALLERRGSVEYVNEEISQEDFAANLAKEWAALPKVVGDNPEQSFYANDGLNKSRVETKQVLRAIAPISPLN